MDTNFSSSKNRRRIMDMARTSRVRIGGKGKRKRGQGGGDNDICSLVVADLNNGPA